MSNYINVKLRDGKDDDLKEWYNSLPKGIKSYVVREALREFKDNKNNILVSNDQSAKEEQAIKESIESEQEQENINEDSQKEMEQKNRSLIDNFVD